MNFTFKNYKQWYKNKVSNVLKVSFNAEDLDEMKQLMDDILDHCRKKGRSVTVVLSFDGYHEELKISRSDKRGENNTAIWVTGGVYGNGGYLVSDI